MKCVVAFAVFGLIVVSSAAPQYANQPYSNQQYSSQPIPIQPYQNQQGGNFHVASSSSSSSISSNQNGNVVQTSSQHSAITVPTSVNNRLGDNEPAHTYTSGYQSILTGQYINGELVIKKEENKY